MLSQLIAKVMNSSKRMGFVKDLLTRNLSFGRITFTIIR